jgi:isoleucyl-tRNA synthetase
LEREGLAREIVRTIQDARKQAGLAISDRIRLYVGGAPALQQALFDHQDYVLQETLGLGFVATPVGADFAAERDVDGAKLVIALKKA